MVISSNQVAVQGVKKESADTKVPRVVVDFSSPNIAKSMHVGHLRSTIQGDSICRIFEFLGYDVKRVNHVGDWGTQFGMLIQELHENFPNFLKDPPDISDLVAFYQKAKERFDADENFKKAAYENVVKLQGGDKTCLEGWKMLCDVSRKEFQKIYDYMDIKLEEVGESFYNPMLAPMVDELIANKIAEESEGAIVIVVAKKGNPLIIRKSDGGFLYGTTDLAAIRYRTNELKADRVVYVTDVGQELHFKQVFAAVEKAGFVKPGAPQLDHMTFGTVQDENGQKFKTRDGKAVQLADLLQEASKR